MSDPNATSGDALFTLGCWSVVIVSVIVLLITLGAML